MADLLEVETRPEWRTWLEKHHASEAEVWLVFHKVRTGRPCVAYEDAVEEALCWIDSAKREATREKRLREVIGRLAAGRKPGLR